MEVGLSDTTVHILCLLFHISELTKKESIRLETSILYFVCLFFDISGVS